MTKLHVNYKYTYYKSRSVEKVMILVLLRFRLGIISASISTNKDVNFQPDN